VTTRGVLAADGPSLVALLAGVADPGNVGTLLRTARGAGASGAVLTEGSADPIGPKAVRASAGAVLHLPVAELAFDTALARLADEGLAFVVADAAAERSIDDVDLRDDVVLVLGNETRGVPEALGDLAVERVAIPLAPGLESLNVAAAGAVLLFEAARQRRMGDAAR
jgi:TrmH family RNA methyltransferase